jgi:hypothetical protein
VIWCAGSFGARPIMCVPCDTSTAASGDAAS